MSRIFTILFGAVVASMARGVLAQTGDSMCNQYLCVTALLNGSTTTFEVLVNRAADTFGWTGTGFGTRMSGFLLWSLVLWPNSDGSISLSQRSSSGHAMPTVVNNPPRVATLDLGLSTLGSSETRMTYTIRSDSSTTQDLIWAISMMRPASSAVDASLIQHYDQGTYRFDLSKPLTSLSPSLTSSFAAVAQSTSAPSDPVSNPEAPFTSADKRIVTHAVLSSVGFAVLMPLGSLWGRYARTFVTKWSLVHWIINFWIAMPIAVAGFAYGVYIMHTGDGPHAMTAHTGVGIALFAIVIIQWILGFVVHYVKPSGGWSRRPPQNYVHAGLGIVIIALAFAAVYLGFTLQWPVITGRLAPSWMNTLWGVWVGVISCAYLAGLVFLPRQYRQERERKHAEPEIFDLPRRA